MKCPKKVTTIMVSFIEYEKDEFEIVATATTKTRIDSAIGILSLGIGALQSFSDAYLDPAVAGGDDNESTT
jgi:hypothetical protein